jgi:tetratricopeptide (TPR) repeat protein
VSDNYTTKINEAGKRLMKHDFEGALKIYEGMAEQFPDQLAETHGHMGAAHHALGRLEIAIDLYEKALAAGVKDDRTVRENLDEARADLAKKK